MPSQVCVVASFTMPAAITVYKAMGIAMEGMVAANLAYRRAKHDHVGGTMAW